MERQPCPRRTLAGGDFATIEQCRCGSIHLTIGGVTLRLSPSALAPLAELIGESARALSHDQMPGLPGLRGGAAA